MRDLTKEERIFLEYLTTLKPREYQGYFYYNFKRRKERKRFKKSRVLMQLHLNKKLEMWELVHHKDGNKKNDSIENLKVLNASEHNGKHSKKGIKKPKDWKPANTLKKEVVNRMREIAKGMVKLNCSEISRRLKKEGLKANSFTIKKYLDVIKESGI